MVNRKRTIEYKPTRRKGTKRASVGVPREEARIQRLLTRALVREPLKRGHSRVVCAELDVASGIADVVSAVVKRKQPPDHWLSPRLLRFVNLTTAKLLAQLKRRRYLPIATIASAAGVSRRTAKQHLKTLERLQIAKFRDDSVMLLRSTKTHFSQVDAYEVKVSDWRHGIYQATHYRTFANRVAVALPDKKAKAVAQNKAPFLTFGVGLVGVGSEGSLKWYIKPTRRSAASASKSLFSIMQILRTKQARALRGF